MCCLCVSTKILNYISVHHLCVIGGKDEIITSDLKILVCFCFFVVCSIFVLSNSSADDKLPLEFQAILSFPGNVIHFGYLYNDFLFLGAQSIRLDFKWDEENGDFTQVDGSNQLLLLKLSPFSGAFYLMAGPAFVDWRENAAHTTELADSGVTARISYKTTFPSKGFLYGLGGNSINDSGLSGGIGFGRIAADPPSVEIEITKIPEGQEVSDANIEKHRQSLIDDSRNLTYIVLAIGWNF